VVTFIFNSFLSYLVIYGMVGKNYLVGRPITQETAKPRLWWDIDGNKCDCSWGHPSPYLTSLDAFGAFATRRLGSPLLCSL